MATYQLQGSGSVLVLGTDTCLNIISKVLNIKMREYQLERCEDVGRKILIELNLRIFPWR